MSEATKSKKYIVVKNKIKVSDVEYDSKDEALSEFNFWNNTTKNFPDGSKVEIVGK